MIDALPESLDSNKFDSLITKKYLTIVFFSSFIYCFFVN